MASLVRRKACWSCRNSKVRCDLNNPTCLNCARKGKVCQSIVLHGSHRTRNVLLKNGYNPHFLNVGSSDIELHIFLSSRASILNKNQLPESLLFRLAGFVQLPIPKSLSYRASRGDELENTLMSYYETAFSAMVAPVDDKRFQGLLLAMSFIDSSPSTIAVQQALYAIIAFYVHGASRAIQFKVNAITALNHSFRSSLNAKDGLQNIAAGLLLSLYETLHSSESSPQWELYACGAKEMAKRIYSRDQVYEGDAKVILNWLFYHDALTKFSARHWIQKPSCLDECARDDQLRIAALRSGNSSKIINIIGCSAEVLEIIAKICEHALDRDDPACKAIEHIEALNFLERRLTHAKQYVDQQDESETSSQIKSAKRNAELYRLAGLVYLYRAGKGLSSEHSNVKRVVTAGFEIIASLETCKRPFPIVILGCEARGDNERLVILELLRRTQGDRKIGNMFTAQLFIETFWAQDDLHTEEVDYVRNFDAIMSLSKNFPSFT